MGENSPKRPLKGILKNSRSFEAHDLIRPDSASRMSLTTKATKFDEMNIVQTLHPADKDYGHMKIDEPKTPYERSISSLNDVLDAGQLCEKLTSGYNDLPKCLQHNDDNDNENSDDNSDDSLETEEKKAEKIMFAKKRKDHYNEFLMAKLACKSLEEEDENDGDGDGDGENDAVRVDQMDSAI